MTERPRTADSGFGGGGVLSSSRTVAGTQGRHKPPRGIPMLSHRRDEVFHIPDDCGHIIKTASKASDLLCLLERDAKPTTY